MPTLMARWTDRLAQAVPLLGGLWAGSRLLRHGRVPSAGSLGDLCTYHTAGSMVRAGLDPYDFDRLREVATCTPGGPWLYPAATTPLARVLAVAPWPDVASAAKPVMAALVALAAGAWLALLPGTRLRVQALAALGAAAVVLRVPLDVLASQGNVSALEAALIGLAAWCLASGRSVAAGSLLATGSAFKLGPATLATWLLGRPRSTIRRTLVSMVLLVVGFVSHELLWGPRPAWRGVRDAMRRAPILDQQPCLTTALSTWFEAPPSTTTLLVAAVVLALPAIASARRLAPQAAAWLPLVTLAWLVASPRVPVYGWVLALGPLAATAGRSTPALLVLAVSAVASPRMGPLAPWLTCLAVYLAGCLPTSTARSVQAQQQPALVHDE